MRSIIFIRRDNIGDLVCTTPAIRAVRLAFPDAFIGVLANTYNATVARRCPDVDEVFVYEKHKHSGKGRLRVFAGNIREMRRMRAARFEVAVGCSYGFSPRVARYSRLTGAGARVGYGPESGKNPYTIPVPCPTAPVHEVEAMMGLVRPLGVEGPTPPMRLVPEEGEVARLSRVIGKGKGGGGGADGQRGLVMVHISSRRPENRWPKEHFRDLADRIQGDLGMRVLLLWSPGSASNPMHPGDDESAAWIAEHMSSPPVTLRTANLDELIAAASLATSVVCCDGGAMHIAAALGKPVLTIWGSTDRRRWAPWGVPNVLLQKDDRTAASVAPEEAMEAFRGLLSG